MTAETLVLGMIVAGFTTFMVALGSVWLWNNLDRGGGR